MSTSQFSVQLSTGNKFWTPKGLGAMGMDPLRAIAELVANSLDWRRNSSDNINTVITIIIGKDFITIRDNGVGMSSKELVDAMQLSVANNELRQNLRIRKGMFGMGMKVACLTLGWNITIISKSILDNSVESKFNLNSRLLDDNNTQNEYRKKLHGEVRSLVPGSPLEIYDSGTDIHISDLTHKSINPINVRDSLQEIFQPEIGVEKVQIKVVDFSSNTIYDCKQAMIAVFEESKINLDELKLMVLDEDTGQLVRIRGWIGLLKTSASGSGEWGLHLFKNNQIIERFHQLPIRLGGLMPKNPHPVYGRLYGEVHLDMCKPAFHKVGFDYSSNSWNDSRELLKKHIEVAMNASKDYKKKDFEKAEQSIRSIQQHNRAANRAISILSTNTSPKPDTKESSHDLKPIYQKKANTTRIDTIIPDVDNITELNIPDNALQLRDGKWFTIVKPIFDDLNESHSNKPWIYHFKKESNELTIVINKSSPVYLNLIKDNNINEREIQIVVNWSISDCIMFLVYDKFYYNLQESSNFRDEQLSKLFLADLGN